MPDLRVAPHREPTRLDASSRDRSDYAPPQGMMPALPALPPDLRATIERNFAANPYTAGTSVSLSEACAIASAVAGLGLRQTIEIGFAAGGSASAVVAAKVYCGFTEKHVVLDPYQLSHSHGTGLEVIEMLGYRDALSWIADWSEVRLPHLIAAGERFDFVMIDGGHGRGQAMVDAYLGDRVLRTHGIMAIHDIYLESTAQSIRFLTEECGYRVVHCQPGTPNPARLAKHTMRLGRAYAFSMLRRCREGLALLQKTREYRGGY
jgi:hypothetical protein